MTSVWELANRQLRGLAVYEPGKPIEETARELGVDPSTIVKLASNENPLGPSPKALEAMRAALEHAHLYPDGSGFYLRKAIAAKLTVAPENVILGNGSNEVIEFLGHAFLNPGDDVITCQYAFIVYKLLATALACAQLKRRVRIISRISKQHWTRSLQKPGSFSFLILIIRPAR